VTDDVQVQMRHARAAGICARGVRDYLKRHGLDRDEFLTRGLPASTLRATGEHFALLAVAEAEKESRGE
jgi:hypothetical protein